MRVLNLSQLLFVGNSVMTCLRAYSPLGPLSTRLTSRRCGCDVLVNQSVMRVVQLLWPSEKPEAQKFKISFRMWVFVRTLSTQYLCSQHVIIPSWISSQLVLKSVLLWREKVVTLRARYIYFSDGTPGSTTQMACWIQEAAFFSEGPDVMLTFFWPKFSYMDPLRPL